MSTLSTTTRLFMFSSSGVEWGKGISKPVAPFSHITLFFGKELKPNKAIFDSEKLGSGGGGMLKHPKTVFPFLDQFQFKQGRIHEPKSRVSGQEWRKS